MTIKSIYEDHKHGLHFFDKLKLMTRERTSSGEVRFKGRKLRFSHLDSFFLTYKEIFLEQCYYFKTSKPAPVIIDCGSNIGLSIIYFKSIYPSARVIGFEPDPVIYQLLNDNMTSFNYSDVQLYPYALGRSEGKAVFASDNALSGHLTHVEEVLKNVSERSVEVKKLSDYLAEDVDFLKIDIEGGEYDVLHEIAHKLDKVQNLFFEYHSFKDQKQHLGDLLNLLSANGFEYYIKEAYPLKELPFVQTTKSYFNLQLNIFCHRNEATSFRSDRNV